MSEHTKGPWVPHHKAGWFRGYVYQDGGVRIAKIGPDADEVQDYKEISPEEIGANAALIAAAPDLLEACEMLAGVHRWAKEHDKRQILDCCEWGRLFAAIAAAKGAGQ